MATPLFDDAFRKKIELLYLVSKKAFAGAHLATRRSKRLGVGIDVRDFRAYAPGDDLRHVDWNYYAGTRDLLVRLFEEEEDLHLYFLVDVSPSMAVSDAAKLRYAKRVAAALAYIGLSNLDRVSVAPFSERIIDVLPPSRGPSQIWKVFDFLARDFSSTQTDLSASMRQFVTMTRRRGLAVLLSDFCDPAGFTAAVDILRFHRFEPLVFHVFDEDDLAPSLRGDLELVDCETGESVRATLTPALLQRYAAAHRALLDDTEAYCRQKNLLYFRAPVQLPFDELVLGVFRAGGFLR